MTAHGRVHQGALLGMPWPGTLGCGDEHGGAPRDFDFVSTDTITQAREVPSGGCVTCGLGYASPDGPPAGVLPHLDASGRLRGRSVPAPHEQPHTFASFHLKEDGDLVAGGGAFCGVGTDAFLVRTDPRGRERWRERIVAFGPRISASRGLTAVRATRDGGHPIVGTYRPSRGAALLRQA